VSKNRKNLSTNTKKKSVDAETVWKDFSATLVKWKLAYELWQKAGKEAMSKYMHVMQSLGPKVELPKQMSKNWEKAWMESGGSLRKIGSNFTKSLYEKKFMILTREN